MEIDNKISELEDNLILNEVSLVFDFTYEDKIPPYSHQVVIRLDGENAKLDKEAYITAMAKAYRAAAEASHTDNVMEEIDFDKR